MSIFDDCFPRSGISYGKNTSIRNNLQAGPCGRPCIDDIIDEEDTVSLLTEIPDGSLNGIVPEGEPQPDDADIDTSFLEPVEGFPLIADDGIDNLDPLSSPVYLFSDSLTESCRHCGAPFV